MRLDIVQPPVYKEAAMADNIKGRYYNEEKHRDPRTDLHGPRRARVGQVKHLSYTSLLLVRRRQRGEPHLLGERSLVFGIEAMAGHYPEESDDNTELHGQIPCDPWH